MESVNNAARSAPGTRRLMALDVLRGVAILLVLGQHAALNAVLSRSGGSGVYLFFVLSGFLISGLLFAEYQKYGSLQVAHFYLRRGLKIYPMFYLLLITTLLAVWGFGAALPLVSGKRIICEALFVQNFFRGIWGHTWTLAVEEHFYFALPLLLLLLTRRSPGAGDPFRALPRIVLLVSISCLLMRLGRVYWFPATTHHHFQKTNYCIDALLFGVGLGYYYWFHFAGLQAWVTAHRFRLVLAAILFLWPCTLFWPSDRIMQTVGETFLYLGFAAVLLLAVFWRSPTGRIMRLFTRATGGLLARIGYYSYSIYLWHGPVQAWLAKPLHNVYDGSGARFIWGVVLPTVVGILLAISVEYPVLRLRDRLFPSRSKTPEPTTIAKDEHRHAVAYPSLTTTK